jgi:hypothetical protein
VGRTKESGSRRVLQCKPASGTWNHSRESEEGPVFGGGGGGFLIDFVGERGSDNLGHCASPRRKVWEADSLGSVLQDLHALGIGTLL